MKRVPLTSWNRTVKLLLVDKRTWAASNGAGIDPTVLDACSRIHPVTKSTLLKTVNNMCFMFERNLINKFAAHG